MKIINFRFHFTRRPIKGNPRQSWILDCTSWIPDFKYWIPDLFHWNFWNLYSGFRIPIVSGIPASYSFIPDSKAQDFGFHIKTIFQILESKFPYMERHVTSHDSVEDVLIVCAYMSPRYRQDCFHEESNFWLVPAEIFRNIRRIWSCPSGEITWR